MTPDALIAYLCASLFESHYRLTITHGEWTVLIEVFAVQGSPTIAHLIGMHGRMVTALRDLAKMAGRKYGLRVHVKLEEEWL